jgi:hypothetical protein
MRHPLAFAANVSKGQNSVLGVIEADPRVTVKLAQGLSTVCQYVNVSVLAGCG